MSITKKSMTEEYKDASIDDDIFETAEEQKPSDPLNELLELKLKLNKKQQEVVNNWIGETSKMYKKPVEEIKELFVRTYNNNEKSCSSLDTQAILKFIGEGVETACKSEITNKSKKTSNKSNQVRVKNMDGVPQSEPPETFTPDIEAEAKKIVEDARLLNFFTQTVSKYHFGDDNVKKHCLVSHVSKFIKGEKLKHNAFTGESAGGKSSCAMKSYYALPAHQRVMFASLSSDKTLYYYCKDNPAALQNKTVYIDEINPELIGLLKSLTNPDGFDSPYVTIIQGNSICLNPLKPFNVWVSSVHPFTEVEMRNRFDYPQVDDSKETKEVVDLKIIKAKAKNELWSKERLTEDRDFKVCRCAIQYLTENKKVNGAITPEEFIKEIREFVSVFNRNDIIGFMAVCNDIAYINVAKRKLTANNEVIVEREDFETRLSHP